MFWGNCESEPFQWWQTQVFDCVEGSLHKANIDDISNDKFGNGCLFCSVMVQKNLHHLEPKGGKIGSKWCRGFCTFPRISLSGSSMLIVWRQNGHVFKCITPYVHSQIRVIKVENQPKLLKKKRKHSQNNFVLHSDLDLSMSLSYDWTEKVNISILKCLGMHYYIVVLFFCHLCHETKTHIKLLPKKKSILE